MQPRKWGRWVLLAIAAVFLFKNPTQAAHMADGLWGLVTHGASALAAFAAGLHP